VDLAGGGTDLPLFAAKHGGAAVAAAISLSVHVEVRLGGNTIRLRSEDRDRRVTVAQPSAITYDGNLDAPKAALNMLPVTGGIEVLTRSDAPPGAGLGERGALDVAVLGALAHCRNEAYDATELAELAFHLEAEELQRLSSRQDPFIAALGGVQALEMGADRVEARAVALDPGTIAEGGAHLLVVYLGRPYAAESAARRVWEAVAAGQADVVDALAGLRDLVAPMVESWELGDWRRAGRLFEDASRHYAVLDPIWSAPPTGSLVAAIREAGAWGVKPAGPRAGASLLVLGPQDRRGEIASAAKANGGVVLDCTLATQGVSVWREDLPEA
jgi:D-glycero-alpha-D-manno-heptose-7-phosphate kinase